MSDLPGTSARDCMKERLQAIEPDQTPPAGRVDSDLALEQVLLTRELFDARVRGVVFGSWEELLAVLADRPSEQGYAALHGKSATIIRLDPARVFAWMAGVPISAALCWVAAISSEASPLLATALLLGLGVVLWWVLSTSLAPGVAGALWPICPAVIGLAGGIASASVLPREGQTSAFLTVMLHNVVAVVLMRSLPQDPDRATLVLNLVLGTWLAFCVLLGAPEGSTYYVMMCAGLVVGAASVTVGARLYFVPGRWGSVELVSWALNVGAVAIFFALAALTDLCGWFAGSWFSWLLFLPVPLAMTFFGQVFGRSLPPVLGALALFLVTIRIAMAAAMMGGSITAVVAFGGCGAVAAFLGSWLQGSERWAHLVVQARVLLARCFGSKEPTHFWTQAVRQPAEPEPASAEAAVA